MDPKLVTLVANANNIFGHQLDQRNRAYAYLLAQATGSMPLDAASLIALVANFSDYNLEMHLNSQIYQLMINTGNSTNFRTFNDGVVRPNWATSPTGGKPIQDAQDVLNIIKFAQLRSLGAI